MPDVCRGVPGQVGCTAGQGVHAGTGQGVGDALLAEGRHAAIRDRMAFHGSRGVDALLAEGVVRSCGA